MPLDQAVSDFQRPVFWGGLAGWTLPTLTCCFEGLQRGWSAVTLELGSGASDRMGVRLKGGRHRQGLGWRGWIKEGDGSKVVGRLGCKVSPGMEGGEKY